jgi:hypothetical protein
MMRKTINRTILLLAAIAIILLVLTKERSPFGRYNSSFAINADEEITRIELSQGEKRLTLVKEDDEWLVDGTSKTRERTSVLMEKVLRELSIKSPLSEDLFDSIVVSGNIDPVWVRVYEKRKMLSSFYVYKTHTNQYGNIMKVKEASKPFIVYIPAYEGDIGSLFSLNVLYWQPYLVFNLLPSEISSVDFINYSDTTSSFSIINSDGRLHLTSGNTRLQGWDSSLVRRYLSYFTRIPFEEWAPDMTDKERDELESGTPLYRITVGTDNEKEIILTLWEMMRRENGDLVADSDRLYGKTADRDQFFILRYFDIDPVIKRTSYFFPE